MPVYISRNKDYGELHLANGAVLAMGSKPPRGMRLPFQVLVLTAVEYQPRSRDFPGVLVLHVPLTDTPGKRPPASEQAAARTAAAFVARHLYARRRVLVTCNMGLNRSGLVTTLALVRIGYQPEDAIAIARQLRGRAALFNPHFRRMVQRGVA